MKTTRRNALLLLGSSALSACAPPTIISRNDNDPFEGGIGGTGIVGTLTGFSSLLINGLRVETDHRTAFRTPFGAATPADLAKGQVLTITARRSRDGNMASEVAIDFALVGTLRSANDNLSVNGVRLIDASNALGHGNVGSRVAVSGIWTSQGVRPSRIDPAPNSLDLIAGTFDAGQVGGVALGDRARSLAQGSYVVALGRGHDGGLSLETLRSGRFARLARLNQLSVEGYLEQGGPAPGFRISGLGHNFARNVRPAAIGTRRALFFGPYDGLYGARRGYLVPDDFESRARILNTGLDDFPGGIIVI